MRPLLAGAALLTGGYCIADVLVRSSTGQSLHELLGLTPLNPLQLDARGVQRLEFYLGAATAIGVILYTCGGSVTTPRNKKD